MPWGLLPPKKQNIQSHTQLVVWFQNHKLNTWLAESACLKEENELEWSGIIHSPDKVDSFVGKLFKKSEQ